MANFIEFNEGKDYENQNGWPATVYFLLSTRGVAAGTQHAAADTLAGGVGEITGTGYSRKNQSRPTTSAGLMTFTQMQWTTGSATDWPNSVRSIVAVTSSDNSGKALAAWDLIAPSGAGRDLSQANTTENVTPSYQK